MDIKPIETAGLSKAEMYATLQQSAAALFSGERNAIANAANLGALIWHAVPGLNWAGFYLWSGKDLVLGPFQGKMACVRIDLGRGVCGRAASERAAQVVADVHQFPGHIACDPDSRSEIVVPLLLGERLLGVLDLDSPQPARFDAEDAAGLEALARIWIDASDHPQAP
jgi:L-methionine (R)-S-oxide reductase